MKYTSSCRSMSSKEVIVEAKESRRDLVDVEVAIEASLRWRSSVERGSSKGIVDAPIDRSLVGQRKGNEAVEEGTTGRRASFVSWRHDNRGISWRRGSIELVASLQLVV